MNCCKTVSCFRSILRASAPVLLLWLALTPPVQATYEISLQPGWNLISLPEQQADPRVETVTTSIEGQFSSIWTYDARGWHVYYPDEPGFSDLRFMDAGKAYWIYMDLPGTLAGAGMTPAGTIALANGWNYVGYNSTSPRPVSEWVQSAGGAVKSVWTLVNGQWKSWSAANPAASTLLTAQPGQGYELECVVQNPSPASAIPMEQGDGLAGNSAAYLSLDVTIPPTTKLLDGASAAKLTALTETKLTFTGTTPLLAALQVNDILASGPLPQAPDGFLRKIAAAGQTAGGWEFTTVDASLAEAIQEGTAGGTYPITSTGIVKANLPEGVRLVELAPDPMNPLSKPLWHLEYDHEIELKNGAKLHFIGTLTLDAQLLVNARLKNWRLEELTCAVTGKVDANLKIALVNEFILGKEQWNLLKTPIDLGTIWVQIGVMPIPFRLQGNIVFGAEGKLSMGLSQKFGFRADATMGVHYYRPDGWRGIRDFNHDFYYDPFPVELELTAKIWAGPRLDVMVWGLAGPCI